MCKWIINVLNIPVDDQCGMQHLVAWRKRFTRYVSSTSSQVRVSSFQFFFPDDRLLPKRDLGLIPSLLPLHKNAIHIGSCVTASPPLIMPQQLQSCSPSLAQEPSSSFSLAGSHYTTAGSWLEWRSRIVTILATSDLEVWYKPKVSFMRRPLEWPSKSMPFPARPLWLMTYRIGMPYVVDFSAYHGGGTPKGMTYKKVCHFGAMT